MHKTLAALSYRRDNGIGPPMFLNVVAPMFIGLLPVVR